MKIFKLMALAAIAMPFMFSCSGGGSSSDTLLFGALPGQFEQLLAEQAELKEKAKDIKSEAEKAELIKKSEEIKEKWSGKIEESAKALDGKQIEFAQSDVKVTQPVSLQYEGFFSKSDMTPKFKINGAAEVTSEINTDAPYILPSEHVYIVGYNAEGQEVYRIKAGFVAADNVDGKSVVKAGTPVTFDPIVFSDNKVEQYKEAKTLKLEVLR